MITPIKDNFVGSLHPENIEFIKKIATELKLEILVSSIDKKKVFIYCDGKDKCDLLWTTFKSQYPNKD